MPGVDRGRPIVSVVMPVYNAGAALEQAVAGIVCQTLTNFELIIVDDASTDGCTDRLRACADARIRVLRNDGNLGPGPSRNRAAEVAAGKYLAIADADDIADPLRLRRQVDLLEARDDLSLVGGAAVVFDERGVVRTSRPVTTPEFMQLGLRYGPSLFHGTVTMRRSAFLEVEGYRALDSGEDYDLYSRLLLAGHRFAAVTDVVLYYREHSMGTSKVHAAASRDAHRTTSRAIRSAVGVPTSTDLVRALRDEPRVMHGEPRLRALKLLGRTAAEHRTTAPAVSGRCLAAGLAAGPSTWLQLLRGACPDGWR